MCRLYGFRSSIQSGIHQSLVSAENALARQSLEHKDGWGIAYYVSRYPHLIRNDQQAFNDALFRDLSAIVATQTFIAHIRRATVGKNRVLNCHPFQHGSWVFAHNGEIGGYGNDEGLRIRIVDLIDARFRPFVFGDTDSEVIFHLFLSRLARRVSDIQNPGVSVNHVISALQDTVKSILEVADEQRTHLNFLIANGDMLVGYRFRKDLYFSTYKKQCPERNTCYAYEAARCEQEPPDGIVKHLILSSERIADNPNVWQTMTDHQWVVVDHSMNFRTGSLF